MKKTPVLLFLVILAAQNCFSQDSVARRKLVYKTTVQSLYGGNTVGWMGTLDDSAIYITSSSIALNEYNQKPGYFIKIDYKQINSVTIKRKGTMGRSILFGTLIGMTVGAIAGLASGDDPQTTIFAFSAEEKAVAGAGGGAVIGCAVGAIVGALAHKTFAIKGRSDKFQEMKTTIFDRLYPVKPN